MLTFARPAVALTIALLTLPLTSAFPNACEAARDVFLDVLPDAVRISELEHPLTRLLTECGVDPSPPVFTMGAEELLKKAAAAGQAATKCDGSRNTSTGALPATFTVTILAAGVAQTLPDAGVAVVATTGGASQTAVFHGDGLYSGVLSSAGGTFRFPKVAHVALPGTAGDADAHCIAGVVAGGSGWASLISGGIAITVSGRTLA